jgi:hypothetical protein
MSTRAGLHVLLVLTAVAAAGLTLLANAGDRSRAELYGATAALIVIVGLIGLPWIEMAADGAFRRRPPPRG